MTFESLRTPCFVVDYNTIVEDVGDMKSQLDTYWNKYIIGYSFKTNNVPGIIKIMKSNGLYAEVVSDDEYALALEIGYSKNNIIFNGPVKSREAFIDAVTSGSIVNIDSKRELGWLGSISKDKLNGCRIGLRVNFCIEEYCPGESQCGENDGRFGFSLEEKELEEAINYLESISVPLKSLHMHCSSKTRGLNIYKALANKVVEIVDKNDLDLEYVDIGGGFFGKMPNKPSFKDYFECISNILRKSKHLDEATIIVEPGMALIGRNLSYICEVIDSKKTKNNRFVTTDGSRIHIDPLQKKSSYFYKIIHNSKPNDYKASTIISGFTCMENDRFVSTEEAIEVGDRVVFDRVGAYTIGLAPLFIQFYPTIYLNNNGDYSILRNKMTAKEFNKIGEVL